jgi:glycosyltransferase involved in cell wall biosynthesis
MRKMDYRAAQRPDYLIANSSYTQEQIKKYYGRDSVVIHPPVDVKDFKPADAKRSGFIITGRQTPYKRFDLAVQACTELNLPLSVIGTGPDNKNLRKMAGPTIDFKGWLSREEVIKHLQSAEAFIFPGLDDFGISAVEAMAAGTPVIAYRGGGALDYVIEGKTGIFFDEQTAESLVQALHHFSSLDPNADQIHQHAERFSAPAFRSAFSTFINGLSDRAA